SDAAVPIGQAADAVVPGESGGQEAIAERAGQAPAAELALRIAGGTEVAVARCLERIGAKLRSAAKGPDLQRIDGVPNSLVARALGPAAVTRLLGDEEAIIRVEAGTLCGVVERWATD